MDSNKRSDVITLVCILALTAILVSVLQPVETLAFQSPPGRSTLPARPPLDCQRAKCGDPPAPTVTPAVSPLAAPARIVAPPTPIQWRSHSPAWPADFRRARR